MRSDLTIDPTTICSCQKGLLPSHGSGRWRGMRAPPALSKHLVSPILSYCVSLRSDHSTNYQHGMVFRNKSHNSSVTRKMAGRLHRGSACSSSHADADNLRKFYDRGYWEQKAGESVSLCAAENDGCCTGPPYRHLYLIVYICVLSIFDSHLSEGRRTVRWTHGKGGPRKFHRFREYA